MFETLQSIIKAPLSCSGDFNAAHAIGQGLQQDFPLEACEHLTDAHVNADVETDMTHRAPLNIEGVWIVH